MFFFSHLVFKSRSLAKASLVVFLFSAVTFANAQGCASPGLDGPVSLTGVINSYHAGVGTANGGANQITVASITGQRSSSRALVAGDLIVVIQMQDSASPASAGQHEYAQIASIAGTLLTLDRPLTNTYVQSITASAAGATTAWRTFQVVQVPQYSSVLVAAGNTVLADAWTVNNTNGQATGGVVAMDVSGSTAVNGTVTVDGAGFRGGAAFVSGFARPGGLFNDANYAFNVGAGNGALKGEGNVGTPFQVFNGTATALAYATTTFGQGYPLGAAGQAAQGNAAGGGNDGNPTASNGQNSGGGGGGNAGAGGRGGNSWTNNLAAGGLGGAVITNSISRLVLGGGGGAGSNNNGLASAITLVPPSPAGRTLPPTQGAANGASGGISSSGAPGGGVVLIRTGSLSGTAGVITARGYDAYNVSTGSDGAGGGGAGGAIAVISSSGTGAGVSLSAAGGGGGYSNFFDHGPGGGGGGGFIATSTNLTGVATNVAGGALGYDGCCGGGQGNASPKAYNSTTGAAGQITALASSPLGVATGSACLPLLTVTKSTNTPTVTLPSNTTAQYSINISNALTAGAAYGVSIRDVLPVPFGLQIVAATGSVTFSGTNTSGLSPVATNQSGDTTTAIFGAGGTGNLPTASSFTVFPGGSVTVTFAVNINSAALGASFQNSASTTFTDPTRATGGVATSSAVNNPVVSPGGAYASGAAVGGANYSSASSTFEDVTVAASTVLTVSKTNGVTAINAGGTTSYTLTFSNSGSYAADNALIKDLQSAGLSCSAVNCSSTTGAASCPTGLVLATATPTASVPNLFNGTGITIPTFPAFSSVVLTVACNVTAGGL